MPPSSQGERHRLLVGAVVQRADFGPRMAVLKVRMPGATWYVVAVAARGVGVTRERPARPEGSQVYGRLEGFRVAWLGARAVGLERVTGTGEERARVEASGAKLEVVVAPTFAGFVGFVGSVGSVGSSIAGAWADEAEGEGEAPEADLAEWIARGEALAGDASRAAFVAKRSDAVRAVKRAVQRIARRAEAVKGDLARIAEAQVVAEQLPWLVAEAGRAPRGARSLTVTDWSRGEARAIVVPLDPAKPARAQVDAMFARARRLKHGAQVASERQAQAEATLAKLGPLEARLAGAEDAAAIDAAIAEARAAAPKDVKVEASAPGGRARGQEKLPPFRTFHARGGGRILVGRGAAHNDALTFQVARPHDLWLHAKDLPGAHVVVPLPKNASCPADVLVDAAHLAAHFSDARDEAVADVQYAQRRHLRKPRGSAPGLVIVDREKVIAVRIEPDVLRALLEAEEAQ